MQLFRNNESCSINLTLANEMSLFRRKIDYVRLTYHWQIASQNFGRLADKPFFYRGNIYFFTDVRLSEHWQISLSSFVRLTDHRHGKG